jgi:hypothetical protein
MISPMDLRNHMTSHSRSRWSSRSCSQTAAAFFVVAALFWPAPVQSACNAIPDRSTIFGTEAQATAKPEQLLPYRGAIGRIDTPIGRAAVPAKRGGFATEVITVGPDRSCDSPRLVASGKLGSPHDYVILIMFPPEPGAESDVPTTAIAIAPDNNVLQTRLRESADGIPDSLTLLGIRRNDGVALVPVDLERGRHNLSFEYPDVAAISFDGRTPIAGPARIIVARADQPIPLARALKSCTDIARDDHFKPLICIDELFFDEVNRCGTRRADLHPGACHFVGAGNRMKFSEQCFPGGGAAFHPAKCEGQPTALEYITAPCGSVLMEFSWEGILRAGDELVKRRLRGSTAVSSGGRDGDGPVIIPGREFLASLPKKNGQGNPHLPDFQSHGHKPGASSLTVVGSADQRESTLFMYPRMIVGRVCEDGPRAGQACAGVIDSKPDCACDAIDDSECSCTPLHAKDARYFACANSNALDGLPCTRASHCWDGNSKVGSCSSKAVCVPPRTVWRPGIDLEGRECETDADCDNRKQCGYSLFDLANRHDLSGRKIQYRIPDGSKQRGFCSRAPSAICGGAAGPCAARAGDCIGYHLEALERASKFAPSMDNNASKLFDDNVPPGIVIGPDGVPDEIYGAFKELERSAQEGSTF